MAIWQASISFDTVSVTPNPDPLIATIHQAGNRITDGDCNVFTSIAAFMVGDLKGNHWAVTMGVVADFNFFGAVEFRATYQLVYQPTQPAFATGPNPFLWQAYSTPAIMQDAPGSAGAGYFGGGTVSLTKNFGANTITMSTPIGSVSRLLDENDAVLLNSPKFEGILFPVGQGLKFTIPNDATHQPADLSTDIRFFAMNLTKDGFPFWGKALTAADPGVFNAIQADGLDVDGAGFAINPPYSPWFVFNQLTFRYEMNGVVTVADYPHNNVPIGGVGPSLSIFRAYRTLSTLPSAFQATDMDLSFERGVVWRGGPDPDDGTSMIVERTYDNAHSWQRATAFSDPTTQNSSPTVSWYNERLYLTWHDGANIREALSYDGGVNWQLPTTIPFSGTNPRRVIDRTGGPSLYFYFNGSGDLLVVISYDSGASWLGPYTIAAAAGPQQIDAEFTPDGSIVASLFIAGIWTQYRSRNLGRDWV